MYVYALDQTMMRACRTPPNESRSCTHDADEDEDEDDDDACAAVCPFSLDRYEIRVSHFHIMIAGTKTFPSKKDIV